MTAAARRRTLAVIGTDLAQQWATRINRHGGDAVAAVLAMGADLIAAKKQLHHGGWERMFAGHPESVKTPLRFSQNTAGILMKIAAHPILSNSDHAQTLPSSWMTLYELTKIDKVVLRAALTEGRITPNMERRHVARLRGATPTRSSRTRPPAVILVGTPIARFSREAQSAIDTLPVDDAEALLEQVEALVVILKKRLAARQKA